MYRRVSILLTCVAMLLANSITAAQNGNEQRDPIVLVAAPNLLEPNFTRSVVLVMFPPDSGPAGVILNRPTDLQLRELWPDQKQTQGRTDTIYFGGPVQQDALVYLFKMTPPPEHAWPVIGDIYFSGNGELLETLVEQHTGPVTDQRFFAGYAGWIPGQLESEIENGDWYVLRADPQIIFDSDAATLWRRLYQQATLPRAKSLPQPEHASRVSLPG